MNNDKIIPGTINRICMQLGYRRFVVNYEDIINETRKVVSPKDADVVTSYVNHSNRKMHAPVLDLDIPHTLVPSSTEGHSHLYLDVQMSWRQYRKLLKVLAKSGIIEKNYAKISINRGHTAVRVPWIKKELS